MGLLTTLILWLLPYNSMVFFAATADAAPQLNHTTIVLFLIFSEIFEDLLGHV